MPTDKRIDSNDKRGKDIRGSDKGRDTRQSSGDSRGGSESKRSSGANQQGDDNLSSSSVDRIDWDDVR